MPKPKWYPKIRLKKLGLRRYGRRKQKKEFLYGKCQWTRPRRTVLLHDRQTPKEFMNTFIHELTHALTGKVKEKKVTRFADRLSQIMWDYGYRLQKKNGFRY